MSGHDIDCRRNTSPLSPLLRKLWTPCAHRSKPNAETPCGSCCEEILRVALQAEASARASAEKELETYERLISDTEKRLCQTGLDLDAARDQVAEITRQREDSDRRVRLAVKALARATGRTEDEITAAPMTIAIEHAAESSLLAQKAADDLHQAQVTAGARAEYILILERRLEAGAQKAAEMEFAKGCECDGCCRLEELRVKLGIADGTADEIAGTINTILDCQEEAIFGAKAVALARALPFAPATQAYPPRCTGSRAVCWEDRDMCDDTSCPRHHAGSPMTDWIQKAAEEIVRSEDLGEGSVRDISAIIQRHAQAPAQELPDKIGALGDPWCDDCRGYSHTDDCPSAPSMEPEPDFGCECTEHCPGHPPEPPKAPR